MTIHVVWGAAEGATPLSAFDRALAHGGVHNYNLVRLSSVIPAEESVVESGELPAERPVGTAVGVVLAEARSAQPGESIAAGIGWAGATEGGIFYEGSGESAESVDQSIRDGLADAKRLREWDWDEGVTTRVVSHEVQSAGAVQACAVFPASFL